MSKAKTHYQCSECGEISPKWQGQCPNCKAWNTLTETVALSQNSRFESLAKTGQVVDLHRVESEVLDRIPTGLSEFDRVLGGGLVRGGVILLGGDPGIGKSTLLLQVLSHLGGQTAPSGSTSSASATTTLPNRQSSSQSALPLEHAALYISGEESAPQIASRARRLQLAEPSIHLRLLPEIHLESILNSLDQEKPQVVVIDSIQTVYSDQLHSAPGSVAQVRECAAQLTRYAKRNQVCMLIVGHVTKEGGIAGPRVLEHIVDTVLQFEGDTHSAFRLIRALKNRFGAVNELGVFAMTEKGIRGVNNPSALFLSQHEQQVSGSCVLVTQEGSRPLLIEIQALVDDSSSPNPRRLVVGLESHRLPMLLAVLSRHAHVSCHAQDVFLNAVGGVKITEPAADLAVLLAIQSSIRNRPLPKTLVAFGEVGLAGEIRATPRGQERLKEAEKLGFTTAIIPAANAPKKTTGKIRVFPVKTLAEAIETAKRLQDEGV